MSGPERRLEACADWKRRAESGDPEVLTTSLKCARQGDVTRQLRAVADSIVIRGTGWYALYDRRAREQIGAAHWCDGKLVVYGPAVRLAQGGDQQRHAVARSRAYWAAHMHLLGDELRADESPGDALQRVEKTKRFQRLVK